MGRGPLLRGIRSRFWFCRTGWKKLIILSESDFDILFFVKKNYFF